MIRILKTVVFTAALAGSAIAITADAQIAGNGDALAAPVGAAAVDAPQVKTFTADDLGMERHKIRDTDNRIWLFNGRHRVHAARWSTTAFFMSGYKFRFDFVDKRSGTRIMDNINEDPGDPLGYNFRPGAPYCIVAQDDTWYPHKSVRTGTFHKKFKTGLTSFGIKTETLVAMPPARACVAVTLTNRNSEPLTLSLLPVQNGKNCFRLPVGKRVISVLSDLAKTDGEGFAWTLPPNATETRHFVISDFDADKAPAAMGYAGATAMTAQCEKDGQEQIRRITSRIPAIKTQSRQLDDLYKRCIASLALCRWDGPGFRNQPTWVVGGGFVCVVSWDFSFAADTLALVDPPGLRNVVRDVLGIGQMKGSYISVHNSRVDWVLYLQDPFAVQEMISQYITITGDRSILDERIADTTCYEWLKRWGNKLHNEFGKGSDGLIDVGHNEQLLIEIRTSDYAGVVPVVNGLAASYFDWLAKLAEERKDPDAVKFARIGANLKKALHERLWNEKAGWFDCLYDGERKLVYSYHLYDLLSTDVITKRQRDALVTHLREGEFLAEYGMYSISRKDTVHWDRQDADFGGGGSYIGMPFRIARRLYEHGEPKIGWEIMKRMARLADHFCIMPQSPQAEEPYEDSHGGNLNISCASAMEAIWSGIFGLRPQDDGTMIVTPAPFNPEVGEAELAGYQFRQHRYDVRLRKTGYEVFVDGKLQGRESYGHTVTVPPLPPVFRISASSVEAAYIPGKALDGSADPYAAWVSQSYGGGTKAKPSDIWWAVEFPRKPVTLKGVKIIGDTRAEVPVIKNMQIQVRENNDWKTVGEIKNATTKDATITFAQPVATTALRVFVHAADIPGDGYVRICELKFILPNGSEENPVDMTTDATFRNMEVKGDH